AEDGIRDFHVTGVQTCALPILVYRNTPYRVPTATQADGAIPDGDQALHGELQGALATKTIAWALLGVGLLIFILGMFATDGWIAVSTVALIIIALGAALLVSSLRRQRAKK